MWHWGIVWNIWRGSGRELHEYVRVLLHLQQFLIRRQVRYPPYGPWEHVPAHVWTAPTQEDNDDEDVVGDDGDVCALCCTKFARPFCPNPQKVIRRNHTHLQQCAPPPVLEQVDGRSRPGYGGIGGRPPIPGLEPPPSRQTPGALPLERPPSERHWILAQGTTTQANTPTTHAGASAPPSLPTLCMAVC